MPAHPDGRLDGPQAVGVESQPVLGERVPKGRRGGELLLGGVDAALHLDRANSRAFAQLARVVDDLLGRAFTALAPGVAQTVEHVRDGGDRVAHLAAQELADGPAGGLAHDVVAARLERLDRVLAGVAVVAGHVPETLEDLRGVERILVEVEVLQLVQLDHRGVAAAGLADALDPLVRLHPDDDARP